MKVGKSESEGQKRKSRRSGQSPASGERIFLLPPLGVFPCNANIALSLSHETNKLG